MEKGYTTYGLDTATIRPIKGHDTALTRPRYGLDTATILPRHGLYTAIPNGHDTVSFLEKRHVSYGVYMVYYYYY